MRTDGIRAFTVLGRTRPSSMTEPPERVTASLSEPGAEAGALMFKRILTGGGTPAGAPEAPRVASDVAMSCSPVPRALFLAAFFASLADFPLRPSWYDWVPPYRGSAAGAPRPSSI